MVSISQELSEHTVEVNVQHEVLDGMFSFYDITKAKLNIFQVIILQFSYFPCWIVRLWLFYGQINSSNG